MFMYFLLGFYVNDAVSNTVSSNSFAGVLRQIAHGEGAIDGVVQSLITNVLSGGFLLTN